MSRVVEVFLTLFNYGWGLASERAADLFAEILKSLSEARSTSYAREPTFQRLDVRVVYFHT